jgi:hypothetical protein
MATTRKTLEAHRHRREPAGVAQRSPAASSGLAVAEMAENPRLATQRRALDAAFGKGSRVNGVVQRIPLYEGAPQIVGDYHAAKDTRAGLFVEATRLVRISVRILKRMKSSLDDFLGELELQPDPTNPVTVKIAELTTLLTDTLTKPPTQARWRNAQAAELELSTLDSDTLADRSFRKEADRLKLRLRQMRRQTFGSREFILTQLGDDESWLEKPNFKAEKTAVTTLRRLKDEVDEMMGGMEMARDFPELEGIPARLLDCEQQARAASDEVFASALAGGWKDNIPDQPDPRAAAHFFRDHIIDRHSMSSPAAGAGKFNTDSWDTIRGRIVAALGAGTLSGPYFDVAPGKPRGRFEILHNSGAAMGTTIAGHGTNRILVVVTRSGKSVVTAYPV